MESSVHVRSVAKEDHDHFLAIERVDRSPRWDSESPDVLVALQSMHIEIGRGGGRMSREGVEYLVETELNLARERSEAVARDGLDESQLVHLAGLRESVNLPEGFQRISR